MDLSNFKPLLASPADLNTLRLPKLLSPKLDGIRCLISNGVAFSRNLKPIPNEYIQSLVRKQAVALDGLDGELVVGDPTDPKCFNVSTSGVMRRDGQPDFKFHAFDRVGSGSYVGRFNQHMWLPEFAVVVPQTVVTSQEELDRLENEYVSQGYEGVMLRDPDSKYKLGRSTAREQILLKVKRFEDCELKVVGFAERMHNGNEATTNLLGATERSSHKENMVGRGDLGALVCQYGDDTVNVGSGFDDAQRAEIWANQSAYLGKWAKVKHQPSGAKDKLRFPVFIGFRDAADL